MTSVAIRGRAQLSGAPALPSDKSIVHRALILAALGEGECTIHPRFSGADNLATLRALAALGVRVSDEGEGGVRVRGVGHPSKLVAPRAPIDCANSGTTMRLLSGVLAAAPMSVTLDGDASLRARPMSRLRPLEAMGASISGRQVDGKLFAPLTIRGGPLSGGTHVLEIASAQVKSALLLAGLYADAPTTVVEPAPSRDHTERMLAAQGAPIERIDETTVVVSPLVEPWSVSRIDVPPDFSAAAFLLAAAVLTNSQDLVVDTGINPTRTGFLDVLVAMGAALEVRPSAAVGSEPRAELCVAEYFAGSLVGATFAGETVLRAIDEVPLVAALGALASGETRVRDAEELRVKESDRLAASVALVRAFGADAEETSDGFVVRGGRALHAAEVDAGGDHRIAMTAAVLALAVEGESVVHGIEAADVSFPGFVDVLRGLGAQVALR